MVLAGQRKEGRSGCSYLHPLALLCSVCGLSDLNCCIDTKVIHFLLIGSLTNTLVCESVLCVRGISIGNYVCVCMCV